MKILITGGAGFIGSNLAKSLTKDPIIDEVRIIDDLSSGHLSNISSLDVAFFQTTILDPEALAVAAHGVDAIVHLAALGSVPRSITAPMPSHEANATGTLRVLEAARSNHNAHVILASSSSVYGANPAIPKTEQLQCMPMSPYAVSKLATEQYAMAYAHCYDLPVLPFRFFNVYGPGQMAGHAYAAVIPVFLEAALTGRPLPVNGDGEQSRDFTYVGTVVETIRKALLDQITGSPTNLAFGTRTTLNNLIEVIATELGQHLEVTYRDNRAGDVRHSQADNASLRRAFPEIQPTPLDTGLQNTIQWMKTQLN